MIAANETGIGLHPTFQHPVPLMRKAASESFPQHFEESLNRLSIKDAGCGVLPADEWSEFYSQYQALVPTAKHTRSPMAAHGDTDAAVA